jgi:dynein heavy chain, axonemal
VPWRDQATNTSFQVFASRGLEHMVANAEAVRSEVDDFALLVPLVQALRNPGMRSRHWDQLSSQSGMQLRPEPGMTLDNAVHAGLLDQLPALTSIADVASKEHAIEQACTHALMRMPDRMHMLVECAA